jgi:DMSO/TMAO reductase YedYZ molybdopterin-dependent catalytic subunit
VVTTRERAWTILRRLPWHRFGAGAIAGSTWLLVTFFLRLYGLGVFLPELAVDFVVGRIPGAIESFFIRTLGEGAKALALLTAVAVFLVLPGIYATFFRRVQGWLKNRWIVMAFYTFSAAAFVLLGILPLLGAGFLGSNTAAGASFASFSQLVGLWVYAAILDYFLVDVAARHPEGFSLSRRQFLVGTVSAVAIAVLAFYGLASLAVRKGRLLFASIEEMRAKEVTPTSEFYVVTKNVFDPPLTKDSWSLSVGGLVSNPTTYDYEALEALAAPPASTAAEEIVTLECVSNEVGGNLISNAKWNGVRLSALLDAAGVDSTADWVVFTCADGYTAAVPISKARDPATILAIRMNDEELNRAHGFPARIIVPGLYGMFHAKWITRLEPVRGEFLGFWQQKGWTNRGQVHTTAIIATPADGSVVRGNVPIGGVAYAGDRGISAVEVSTDGGATWADASLYPSLSPLGWVLWRFDWSPPRSGSFRIVARAVDRLLDPQEPNAAPPFPDGAMGYDSIALLAE